MKMKLPAYPVATIDPHFSIWSKTDTLTESDTQYWYNLDKKIEGKVIVDGTAYTFLSKGENPLEQTGCDITPFTSEYFFKADGFNLSFKTWSPFLFDDFHIMSVPCAFFDVKITFEDADKHNVSVCFIANEQLCYGTKAKMISKYTHKTDGLAAVKMGCTQQEPLCDSGDEYSPDWGYISLCGGDCACTKDGISVTLKAECEKCADFTAVISYDDVYSINYFGQMLKGLWTEKFSNIEAAMSYCLQHHDELLSKIEAQDAKILSDAEPFGENYKKILCAAPRQVMAGHKLVRNEKGELLYLSKEHHSNGCINTVDVSYPAMPMYLLYAPELVKAMMTGIFYFANTHLWNVDFAPHDIGRYPLACGQVYALNLHEHLIPHKISYKNIYKKKSTNIYMPQFQMPVEECGNMLIMSYAYYKMTGDKEFITENFYTLSRWAKYLKNKGIILDTQLCTDDFAGHSKKNVNLAIKAIMGLACFSRISDEMKLGNTFMDTAESFANELLSACCMKEDYLPFSVGKKDSWSLKYNLVWDILFGFGIFSEDLYKAESEKYRKELNAYGVPLDYRRDFTKTDWELWAACLDSTNENIDLFSGRIVSYLADTKDRNCFSDWVETKTPVQSGFDHRTVQGGLFLPILKNKLLK